MPRLTPLHRNVDARRLGSLDHRLLHREREGVVGLAQQVGDRDVAPGSVGDGADQGREGMVFQLAGPVLGGRGGEVVVEVVGGVEGGDVVALREGV